ncbi:unnamed protein product [Arctia plantaginis]|uniref:Uncharacterized protein n=1 Tax=Arctia plantaginis TaxID=874455 RepID=A0A8S1B0P5_ARCPL|nr:unnamed protein product [Arctia plantaginis]
MFQYLLAFLLINSCYRSFGIPTQRNTSISLSLVNLATQCENKFLSNVINNKTKACNVLAPPYLVKQIRCLIFYDISKQLCEAVATSKIALTKDVVDKLSTERDITTVCTLAQDWVFTNLTEYDTYKNTSEYYFKKPVTCGEICSVEGTIDAVNEYCKYYEWGLELLKSQVLTTSENANNIIGDAPNKPEPDSNVKSEKVTLNSQSVVAEIVKTKTVDGQIKQTESAVLNPTPVKSGESDIEVSKPTTLTTSGKQTLHQENAPTIVKNMEADGHALEHPILLEVNTNEQANKSIVPNEMKQTGEENDPALLPESGKDAPSLDSKGVDQAEGKGPSDDDYPDSEGNDGGDDDGEDQGIEIKSEKKPEPFVNNKLTVSHESDVSQKEFYPNTVSDTYSDDGDNFFPFFLTAVILVVLLYVLYHNKSKVSKVFFGLILEGRQGGRRRNSRGHAYRRLDTLEQAMSTNTAAPPSKIIY